VRGRRRQAPRGSLIVRSTTAIAIGRRGGRAPTAGGAAGGRARENWQTRPRQRASSLHNPFCPLHLNTHLLITSSYSALRILTSTASERERQTDRQRASHHTTTVPLRAPAPQNPPFPTRRIQSAPRHARPHPPGEGHARRAPARGRRAWSTASSTSLSLLCSEASRHGSSRPAAPQRQPPPQARGASAARGHGRRRGCRRTRVCDGELQ
jgi:hypothetical protein